VHPELDGRTPDIVHSLIQAIEATVWNGYGGPQGQCSDVCSSAGVFAPVQQYLFQCRIGHPSAEVFGPVQD